MANECSIKNGMIQDTINSQLLDEKNQKIPERNKYKF